MSRPAPLQLDYCSRELWRLIMKHIPIPSSHYYYPSMRMNVNRDGGSTWRLG